MDGRMDVIRAGNDEQPLLYNRNRVRTKTAVYPKARKERVRGASCKKKRGPSGRSGVPISPARVASQRGYGGGAGYLLPNHERERMTGYPVRTV